MTKAELLEEKIKRKNRMYSSIIAFRIFGIIFIIILAIFAWQYYIYNVRPYSRVKSCYRKNEEQFNEIVSYFDGLKADYEHIDSVYIEGNGKIVIREYIPDSVNMTAVYGNCSTDSGYIALKELENKYDDGAYQFFKTTAEYSRKGNMTIEIPVYFASNGNRDARESVGYIYYLVYHDAESVLDYAMSSDAEKHSINENWFIYSRKAYIG